MGENIPLWLGDLERWEAMRKYRKWACTAVVMAMMACRIDAVYESREAIDSVHARFFLLVAVVKAKQGWRVSFDRALEPKSTNIVGRMFLSF